VTVLAALACLPREGDHFGDLRRVFAHPVPNWRRWRAVGAAAAAIIAAAVLIEILVARAFLSSDQVAALLPIVDRARIVEVLIVAPLLEEIVYRLVIAGVVADRWGKRAAIVASFVVFAAVHFARGNLDVANLLAGGFFAWVFLTSRSLLVSMGFHAVGNLLATIVQLVWAAHLGHPVMRALSVWHYR
jgi:membrane protease YdiL (CAAX protease family)